MLAPDWNTWTNPAIASATPSNSDLANKNSWRKIASDKEIGIAMLKHKI